MSNSQKTSRRALKVDSVSIFTYVVVIGTIAAEVGLVMWLVMF